MKVSVVIPTIAGREDLLERTVKAYKAKTRVELELIVVRNQPTCGEAWNIGAEQATGDWLHLTADDVLPWDHWFENASQDALVYPSPRLMNENGTLHSCGSMGGGMLLPDCSNGTPCNTSSFPFLDRETWDLVGPSLPIHYYADDYLSYRARKAGLQIKVNRGYTFTHLEGTVGRPTVQQRAMDDCQSFLRAVAGGRSCE